MATTPRAATAVPDGWWLTPVSRTAKRTQHSTPGSAQEACGRPARVARTPLLGAAPAYVVTDPVT
ncbi:hypothetical protein [Streptomyces sp. NPDC002644]